MKRGVLLGAVNYHHSNGHGSSMKRKGLTP